MSHWSNPTSTQFTVMLPGDMFTLPSSITFPPGAVTLVPDALDPLIPNLAPALLHADDPVAVALPVDAFDTVSTS